MKLIYIAGPFRAANYWLQEQNIRRAETAALEVWKLGTAVICPHANTRFFQGAVPDHVWLDGDLEIIRRCDALLLVEGWENSVGARGEVEMAKQYGLKIFRNINELKSWLEVDCENLQFRRDTQR
jgi:hypothetical protein